jgi:hypothetical protein
LFPRAGIPLSNTDADADVHLLRSVRLHASHTNSADSGHYYVCLQVHTCYGNQKSNVIIILIIIITLLQCRRIHWYTTVMAYTLVHIAAVIAK